MWLIRMTKMDHTRDINRIIYLTFIRLIILSPNSFPFLALQSRFRLQVCDLLPDILNLSLHDD